MKQRQLKLGSTVWIKTNLVVNHYYGSEYFVSGMKKYSGKKAKIVRYSSLSDTYHINLDEGTWEWSKQMFLNRKPYTHSQQYLEKKKKPDWEKWHDTYHESYNEKCPDDCTFLELFGEKKAKKVWKRNETGCLKEVTIKPKQECKMTFSGKHIWPHWMLRGELNKCRACGLVDDTK